MRLPAKFALVHLYYLCKHLLIHYLPATKKKKKEPALQVSSLEEETLFI